MSVLSRELDAYQRAVDAYQRSVNSYNRGVDAYRSTLVRDANGRLLLATPSGGVTAVDSEGRIAQAVLPAGFDQSQYGMTGLPDSAYSLLRQNPKSVGRETRDDVYYYAGSSEGNDQPFYYYYGPEQGDAGAQRHILGGEWRVDQKIPGFSSGDNQEPDRYVVSRDASIYPEQPGDWTKKFGKKAPDPTGAQMKKMGMPTLAEVEAGLIGEVIKGGGVRYGVPVYRPKDELYGAPVDETDRTVSSYYPSGTGSRTSSTLANY